MLADAFEVTTVTQTWLRAVVLVRAQSLYLVVVGATGCKAVGHKHIEHVGIAESIALLTFLLPGL